MIIRKSPDELDKMRTAGRIVAGTIGRVLDAVAPGRTTLDLDRVAEQYIAEQDATPSFKGYRGASNTPFPATICASVNEEIVHGIPSSDRRLEEGDLLSLDFAAISVIAPGGKLSDIGNAIETVARLEGMGIVREYGGHGIGRALHEDPFIQNWGKPGRGPELRPGLVVAVEPMLNFGGDETAVMPDGWTVVTADGSLSAHFEHTVAVTPDGPEVLTARD